jgi:hypothetical protein
MSPNEASSALSNHGSPISRREQWHTKTLVTQLARCSGGNDSSRAAGPAIPAMPAAANHPRPVGAILLVVSPPDSRILILRVVPKATVIAVRTPSERKGALIG